MWGWCFHNSGIIHLLCVKGIIPDKVVCFDTLLQVLILKGLTLHQNSAKGSVDSKGIAGGVRDRRRSAAWEVRRTAGPIEALGKRGRMALRQRSNEATKQRSNEATKQRSNEATKQRSNEATKQSNEAIIAYWYSMSMITYKPFGD